MAKKKKASSVIAAAPATSMSRYASPPVTLLVGPELQAYYVPEVLLQSLKDHPRSGSGHGSIHLQDVEVETGHVIVHFLFTGQYQTLDQTLSHDDAVTIPSTQAKSDFKKALRVLVAAKKYKLMTLQELAKLEIIRCGDKMTIADVAHAISKDLLTELQDDAVWLQDLVLQKADQAFHESNCVFSSDSFFSNIKNPKLAKLLAQRVAKLYHDRFEEMNRIVCEAKRNLDVMVIAKPTQEVDKRNLDVMIIAEPAQEVDTLVPAAPSDKPIEVEESASPPPGIEHPAGGWGIYTVTKETKKKKEKNTREEFRWFSTPSISSPVAEPKPALAPGPGPKPEPALIEGPAPDVHHPVAEVEMAVDRVAPAAEPVAEESSWGSFGTTTTTTKKTKKKKSSTVLLEEYVPRPHPEPVPEPLRTEDDGWGSYSFGDDKKKIEEKGAIEEVPPPPEPEPVVEEPVTEPVLEPVYEAPAVDPFAGLSKSQKKKLEKKMKENAEHKAIEARLKRLEEEQEEHKRTACAGEVHAAAPESLDVPLEQTAEPVIERECYPEAAIEVLMDAAPEVREEAPRDAPLEMVPEPPSTAEDSLVVVEPSSAEKDDDWGYWSALQSSSKKKKKKKAKTVIVEAPPSPLPRPGPEMAVGEDRIERPAPEEPAPPADRDYHSDSAVEVNGSDDDNCPHRCAHLSNGNLWKNCAPCELYMRKIAMKVHSAGMPDVNGLVFG